MSVLLKVREGVYVNPSHIVQVLDMGGDYAPLHVWLIRPVTDEVHLPDMYLERGEWAAIEPLVTVPARAAGSTPTPQSVTRQAVDEIIADEEPVIQWARVIEVEKDQFYSKTSRGHRDMWRLRTSDGRQVNIFDHADPLRDQKSLLKEAGYWDIFSAMDMSHVDRWDTHPIQLDIVADGAFWKVMNFALRPDSAGPDAPLIVSEEALMADYAKKQEGWHADLVREEIERPAMPTFDDFDSDDDDDDENREDL